jgi:hypothetical protein
VIDVPAGWRITYNRDLRGLFVDHPDSDPVDAVAINGWVGVLSKPDMRTATEAEADRQAATEGSPT